MMEDPIDERPEPGGGAAYEGTSFYIWDESAEVADRWARELRAVEDDDAAGDRWGAIPRRILVPVDFSPACRAATRHAQRIAKPDEAEIHLLHVFLSPRHAGDCWRAAPALRELRDRALERMRVLARCMQAPTCTHLFAGEPAAVIRETARGLDADLLVLGAQHRGRPGAMGSVARSLQEDPPCPLHVVGPLA